MKKLLSLVIAVMFLFTGCIAVHSPAYGMLYTDTKGPVAVNESAMGSKVGKAQAYSVLALVALGDASIKAAADKAGITKIHSVDHETWSLLGIYGTYTTIVRGE